MNKILDCKASDKVFMSKYDPTLIKHTQVWAWLSGEIVAVYQDESGFRLDAWKDGTLGTWSAHGGANQKFNKVMSGKLGKYDLC